MYSLFYSVIGIINTDERNRSCGFHCLFEDDPFVLCIDLRFFFQMLMSSIESKGQILVMDDFILFSEITMDDLIENLTKRFEIFIQTNRMNRGIFILVLQMDKFIVISVKCVSFVCERIFIGMFVRY